MKRATLSVCLLSAVLMLAAGPTHIVGTVINSKFLDAVQFVESSNNADAVGKAGERGLFQITEAVWKENTDEPWDKAFDPEINRKVATIVFDKIEKTIKRKTQKQPTMEQVLVAYNAGLGRLQRIQYKPEKAPKSTRDYIKKIKKRLTAAS